MKPCMRCGAIKPLAEFYTHPNMPDGHLNKCKPCTCADVRANRRTKLEYYRAYDRKRYRADPERRAYAVAMAKRMADEHPERRAARTAVNNAIRDGRLTRGTCEVCGAVKVEAHHDDYSRPLDVRWFCTKHHNAHHHPTGAVA